MFVIGQCFAVGAFWPIGRLIFLYLLSQRFWQRGHGLFGEKERDQRTDCLGFSAPRWWHSSPLSGCTWEIIHLYVSCHLPTTYNLTAMYFTVEESPVPQLIGCVTTAHNSSYLATIYVMLMFYDGGKHFIFGEKSALNYGIITGLLLLMIAQGVSARKFAFSFLRP